jgi:hypothetical protein
MPMMGVGMVLAAKGSVNQNMGGQGIVKKKDTSGRWIGVQDHFPKRKLCWLTMT